MGVNENFNHRFTHALLITVIVLMTKDDWYGLHAAFLITACFAWALWYPVYQEWIARKARQ